MDEGQQTKNKTKKGRLFKAVLNQMNVFNQISSHSEQAFLLPAESAIIHKRSSGARRLS